MRKIYTAAEGLVVVLPQIDTKGIHVGAPTDRASVTW